MIHRVKGFSIVNEAEVHVFLEFPCFFYDPTDAGDLISGSSAFLKSSLYIQKLLVHVLQGSGDEKGKCTTKKNIVPNKTLIQI